MNENEIRDVLGEGIGEEPPIVGGPAAVFAGARARVVRTRAVTGALSVVAVLGVAAGAVAIGGGSGGSGVAKADQAVTPGAVVAPPVHSTPVQPPTTTPTAAAKNGYYSGHGTKNPAPVPGPGQVLTDGRSVGEILKSLLPSGFTTANYAGQDSYQPAQYGVRATASMSVDDGTGKLTTLSGGIAENNTFAFRDMNCPTMAGFEHSLGDCQSFPQPDGSVILTYRENDFVPDTNGPTAGSYSWKAWRAFPDGSAVFLDASNYFDPLTDPHNKGWHVSPTRPNPLVTVDQLKAMLSDPRWGLTVSAQFAQQAKSDLVPYADYTMKS